MKTQSKILSSLLLLGALTFALSGKAVAAVGTQSAPNVMDMGVLTAPTSVTYGNTFFAPTTETFYDNFTFNLNMPTALSSITASIDLGSFLGINNISARVFEGSGAFVSTMPIVVRWSTPFSSSGLTGSTTVISLPSLASGTYTMQIRGDVIGTAGGSYSGVMNIAPVAPIPEPETYGMLLAGLGLVALASCRKFQAKQ